MRTLPHEVTTERLLRRVWSWNLAGDERARPIARTIDAGSEGLTSIAVIMTVELGLFLMVVNVDEPEVALLKILVKEVKRASMLVEE